MVEGPGVHRVAIAHTKLLRGQRLRASSPNGKFTDGAAAVDGQVLALIEAHGKNIFYFFTHSEPTDGNQPALENLPEDAIVVHIHFGMSGSFRTFPSPGPESRPATRLRLVAEKVEIVAHLSANLCKHGSLELYRKTVVNLGPDPLREDADKERLWASLQTSRRKIGAVLMDQSLVAGIGNIYRTELLFVIGVHPDQSASSLTRSTFEMLWSEAQRLLQLGVLTGSIVTVSQDEAGKPFSKLRKGEKRYIYNHRNCRRCGGKVQSWKLAQRTVYACEACQPLTPQTGLKHPLESHEPGVTFQEHILVENHDSMIEIEEGTHYSKALQCDSTPMVVSQELEYRGRCRRQTVEHQAFKDITTGGLLDFHSQNDDAMLQSFAPMTPQKPSDAKGTKKCYKRGRKFSRTGAFPALAHTPKIHHSPDRMGSSLPSINPAVAL